MSRAGASLGVPPEWDMDATSAEARPIVLRGFEDGCAAVLVVELRRHSGHKRLTDRRWVRALVSGTGSSVQPHLERGLDMALTTQIQTSLSGYTV